MNRRILLVDDDAAILRELEGHLASKRDEWDVVTAESGEEALDKLEGHTTDLILSDTRMPEMDGPMLLDRVSEVSPSTIRFLMASVRDADMAIRLGSAAHRFLVKPLGANDLTSTINAALELHEMLDSESLREVVTTIRSLVSPPSIYSELVDAVRQPTFNMDDVGRIVMKDPAIASRVLQIVNSSFFSLSRDITNINEAVGLVGLQMIKSLILSVHIFTTFSEAMQVVVGVWDHSMRTACIAKTIMKMERASSVDVDTAFTAGLLHDVGKLIFATELGDRYLKVFERARMDGQPLHVVERRVMQASHSDVGAYMFGMWGLPDSLLEAVAFHHEPRRVGTTWISPLIAVHIADYLDHSELGDESALAEQANLDLQQLETCGIDSERLEQYKEACRQALSEQAAQ